MSDWIIRDNGARIHKTAHVAELAKIGDGATIGTGAKIAKDARGPVLFLHPSCHPITVVGPSSMVSIGCHSKPIDWWLEHYPGVGYINDYTDEQITEYGKALRYVDAWIQRMMPWHRRAS